ncbi:MAG: hypothetical protein M8353_02875 [ANME-2 cluster archaeon]|nr:hypothetical protein [ANME-2 cluster archaeon]
MPFGHNRLNLDTVLTSNNGLLIQGIAWLIFWLGPAFYLFREDPRWGHNFALPIIFITVGSAFYFRKNSCQLIAVISSFSIVPTLLAFWSWSTATGIALGFLGLMIILHFAEKGRESELVRPNPRLNAWLKLHLMTFAYIGLAHMSLIFFLVRWFNSGPFSTYLPFEHYISTSIFNAMLFILVFLAILERFVRKIGTLQVGKVGFSWAILMMILPMISIKILGE